MASRSVKSGGSLKGRKGNGWEREVAYNLQQLGFKVTRIDDNTPGVDLIAESPEGKLLGYWHYVVECKFHKGFSWNELVKIYNKTRDYADKLENKTGKRYNPIVVFKANRQPPLVMVEDFDNDYIHVLTFEELMKPHEWKKIPKGYKIWQ